jgi:hypothetical protein
MRATARIVSAVGVKQAGRSRWMVAHTRQGATSRDSATPQALLRTLAILYIALELERAGVKRPRANGNEAARGRLGALIGDDVLSAEPGDLPVPKTK